MCDPGSLLERIEALTAAADDRIHLLQRRAGEQAKELQVRRERFEIVARHLIEISDMSFSTLVNRFDNASVRRSHDRDGYHVICSFRHTERYPASVELRFDLAHDPAIDTMVVTYHLQVLPVFIEFEHRDQIAYDLDAVDEGAIRTWVEDKIVSFVRTYMEIQFTDAYQRENIVTDPVSGVRFSRILATTNCDYRGRTYYFLSNEARHLFESNPDEFLNV